MREAFPALRARGGRGPQIGPGTFEVYTGQEDDFQPARFTAIVYSEGIVGQSSEHWCFLNKPNFVIDNYKTLDPDSGLATLWFDQVPSGADFTPPADPTSLAAALKQYAVSRYYTKYSADTITDYWDCRSSHLFATTGNLSQTRKIVDGVHRVLQLDYPHNERLKAWVWISQSGGHEVWIYFRPSQVNGFLFVGLPHPVTGIQQDATRLKFQKFTPTNVTLNTSNYFATTEALKHYLADRTKEPLTPAGSVLDLMAHHHRVVRT